MAGNLDAAREIFERYDGSSFYMAHDGILETYQGFAVPRAVESQWLAEMTARYVARLADPGNWKAIHFFSQHGDCRHLALVSRQAPRGVLWERIAYLEHLMDYARLCRRQGCNDAAITEVVARVRSETQSLRNACRSARTRARVDQVNQRANELT